MALMQRPFTSVAAAVCLLVLASTILNDETEALKLIGLKVPKLVRNGTEESAVLDCVYDLGSISNASSYGGLVVKWYIEGQPYPVYQWIPTLRPQDHGLLKGRLDLEYQATNEENTMHRALFIRRPTVELSGKYTCSVSTFAEEKSVSETMVVFVPEKTLMLSHTKPRDDLVRVSCKAEGVYPEPNITLALMRHQPGASLNHLRDDDEDSQATPRLRRQEESEEDFSSNDDVTPLLPLEGMIVQTRPQENGVFDAEAWAEVPDRYLKEGMEQGSPVSFHCLLAIPNSAYSRRKSIIYYPGPPTTPSTLTTQSSQHGDNGSSAILLSPTWSCYFLLLALIISQRLALRS